MNWTLLIVTLVVMLVLCQIGWGQDQEDIDYQGANPYLSDKWLPLDRNGQLQEFIYLIFKYGQATCIDPLYDLAIRMCKADMVNTPFEPFVNLCTGCLLIRDLDKCIPPCSPNNYTCQYWPMNVEIVGAYNFIGNIQQGAEGFAVDQRG